MRVLCWEKRVEMWSCCARQCLRCGFTWIHIRFSSQIWIRIKNPDPDSDLAACELDPQKPKFSTSLRLTRRIKCTLKVCLFLSLFLPSQTPGQSRFFKIFFFYLAKIWTCCQILKISCQFFLSRTVLKFTKKCIYISFQIILKCTVQIFVLKQAQDLDLAPKSSFLLTFLQYLW